MGHEAGGWMNDDQRAAMKDRAAHVERLEQYAERMAQTVRIRRKAYAERLRAHAAETAKLDDELVAIRLMCPHVKRRHHPRTQAEADEWTECDDCGATL